MFQSININEYICAHFIAREEGGVPDGVVQGAAEGKRLQTLDGDGGGG